jgi:DNA-binding NtrC family response regulator
MSNPSAGGDMISNVEPSKDDAGQDQPSRREFPVSDSLAAIAIYLSRKTEADLHSLLSELERRIIIETLKSTQGNQLAASQRLGVKYTTLNDKIKRHRIALQKRIVVESF